MEDGSELCFATSDVALRVCCLKAVKSFVRELNDGEGLMGLAPMITHYKVICLLLEGSVEGRQLGSTKQKNLLLKRHLFYKKQLKTRCFFRVRSCFVEPRSATHAGHRRVCSAQLCRSGHARWHSIQRWVGPDRCLTCTSCRGAYADGEI